MPSNWTRLRPDERAFALDLAEAGANDPVVLKVLLDYLEERDAVLFIRVEEWQDTECVQDAGHWRSFTRPVGPKTVRLDGYMPLALLNAYMGESPPRPIPCIELVDDLPHPRALLLVHPRKLPDLPFAAERDEVRDLDEDPRTDEGLLAEVVPQRLEGLRVAAIEGRESGQHLEY